MRSTILFCFLFLLPIIVSGNGEKEKIDLRSHWLIYEGGKFVEYDGQQATSVYFWVDGKKNKGHYLQIESRHNYSLFFNSKLVFQKNGLVRLSLDSLSEKYSNQLFVTIVCSSGVSQLKTELETDKELAVSLENSFRKGNYFQDFSLVAALVLVICFTLFLRTNPALTLDYIDVRKLFSLQDKEESTLSLRIASSVNILFYFFGSCFLALMLLIAFHLMGDQIALTTQFPMRSAEEGFLQWAWLSVIIFGLLITKLILLVILTAIFGFRDTVRFQFFNFVRLIFISVSLLAALCIIYFIMGVRKEMYFYHLLTLLSGIFIFGTALTFFKLQARMPFHFFHLFSYLCASEIIPLMILIKVFFY